MTQISKTFNIEGDLLGMISENDLGSDIEQVETQYRLRPEARQVIGETLDKINSSEFLNELIGAQQDLGENLDFLINFATGTNLRKVSIEIHPADPEGTQFDVVANLITTDNYIFAINLSQIGHRVDNSIPKLLNENSRMAWLLDSRSPFYSASIAVTYMEYFVVDHFSHLIECDEAFFESLVHKIRELFITSGIH